MWLGSAWLGLAWLGLAWLGLAWLGLAWLGLAWLGLAWLGLAWLGLAWLGLAWLGLAWLGLAWSGLAWRSVSVSKSRKIDLFYEHLRKFQYSILLDIEEGKGSCPFLLGFGPSFSGVGPSFSGVSPSFWGCWPFLLGLLAHPSGVCFFLEVWPFLDFCIDFGGGHFVELHVNHLHPKSFSNFSNKKRK